MTCAKRHVGCLIVDYFGNPVAYGTNACDNPQKVCPRAEGEGYTKCDSICMQDGHAEIVALRLVKKAGVSVVGGNAYVIGHNRICERCAAALDAAGIENIYLTGARQ